MSASLVGSEMCIRDRPKPRQWLPRSLLALRRGKGVGRMGQPCDEARGVGRASDVVGVLGVLLQRAAEAHGTNEGPAQERHAEAECPNIVLEAPQNINQPVEHLRHKYLVQRVCCRRPLVQAVAWRRP
eukprot:911340-Alexandrium_andersonii.AAC.1